MHNKVSVEGIITVTPTIKNSKNGVPYIFFTIENKEENSTHSNWIDCMAWRNNAEFIAMNVQKGQKITISGKLMTMPQTSEKGKTTYINVENAYIEAKRESTPIDLEDIQNNNADDEIPF